jgi:hypothetical protein
MNPQNDPEAMIMISPKNLLWLAFAIFVAGALYFNWHENIFASHGRYVIGKYIVWAAFAGFLAYSIMTPSWRDFLSNGDERSAPPDRHIFTDTGMKISRLL